MRKTGVIAVIMIWVCLLQGCGCGCCVPACDHCNDLSSNIRVIHTPSQWIVVKEPTPQEDGLQQIVCTVCGTVLREKSISLEQRKEQYKAQCECYSYDAIAKDPESYQGKYGYVFGKVLQILEGEGQYTLRVAMEGVTDRAIVVLLSADALEDQIQDADHVQMYGIWHGTCAYRSAAGMPVTVPLFFCEYLEL